MRRIPAFFCCFACHAAHPPAAAPDAPTVVSATSGVRSASLSWNAPSDGGAPITGYVIHQSDGGAFARVQAVARGTQATVASLNYGLTYRFKVQAENSVGAGPLSDASPAVTFPDAFTLAAPALVIARQYHTATLLPTGSVLVVGGAGSSAELYEPGAGAMPTGGLHALRYQHTATLLHDGTILIAGGRSNGTGPLGSPFPTDAETYDAGAFTLTTKGLVTGRTLTDAALLADGRVLVAGGLGDPGNGGGCCTPLASAEVYDPSLRAFSSTGSLIAQRDSHTATALSNGRVLIAGGFDGNALASSEIYDPEHGAFIPAKHRHGGLELIPRRQLVIRVVEAHPAVKRIRPLLGDDVHQRCPVPAVLGREVVHRYTHFLHILGVRIDVGDPVPLARADGGRVHQKIVRFAAGSVGVQVNAVLRLKDVAARLRVGLPRAAAGQSRHARRQDHERIEVAAG